MTATAARFQETANAPAQLRLWGARALYLGPALNLSAHRNAVAVVALALDQPFGVAHDPAAPAAGYRTCRSALILADTLHHLAIEGGRMAFLYLDAASLDLARLAATVGEATTRAGFDLSGESELIALLTGLAEGRTPWADVRAHLTTVLGGVGVPDPRVRAVLDRLHAQSDGRLDLDDLAATAGLSSSRFRHLFRAATGVTVRRYRLWVAMGSAMRAVVQGASLTTAALDAGFSSSAHFSAAFREMFGLEPSRLAKGRLVMA